MTLAVRVIPTLLFDASCTLVKGTSFDGWRRVGSVLQAVNVFQARGVDELLLLDITATREGRGPNLAFLASLAPACRVPLTYGGGIRSVDDVRALLRAGADKVCLQTARALVPDAARQVGAQALVVCIESRGLTEIPTGTGEVLLQHVARDGTLAGYDLDWIGHYAKARWPVIASGGCAGYADMLAAVQAGASAVAAGALWQFTDATPRAAKAYLAAHGVPVRS